MDKISRKEIERLRSRVEELLEEMRGLVDDYDAMVDMIYNRGYEQGETDARDDD